MIKKKTLTENKLLITFLVIVTIIFGLAFGDLPRLIPFFIVLLSIVFYINKSSTYLITLFLILLPVKEFVSESYMLPGGIAAIYFPSFLSMVVLIRKSDQPRINKALMNVIKSLVLFFIIYFIYVEFKNVFFGLEFGAWKGEQRTFSYIKVLRRAVKLLFTFMPLYFIPQKMENKKLWEIMKTVVISIVIIWFISQVFAEVLSGNIRDDVSDNAFDKGVAVRTGGLFARGDVNSLGAAYVLLVGLILFVKTNFNRDIYSKYLLPVLIIGILYTISRGAILGLFIMLVLYYLYTSKARKVKFTIAFGISILLILFMLPFLMEFELINVTMERFGAIETTELSTTGKTNRLGGWIYYLEFIFSNPMTLVTGTDKVLLTSVFRGYARVPHNIYLTILFNGGLVFLGAYVYIIIFKINQKNVLEKSFNMIYFPFLFMTFLLSDIGSIVIFIYVLITIFSVKEIYSSSLKKPVLGQPPATIHNQHLPVVPPTTFINNLV